MKSNKKAIGTGMAIFIVVAIMIMIGLLVTGIFMLSGNKASFSVSESNPYGGDINAGISAISGSFGSDIEGNQDVWTVKYSDLTTSVKTLSLNVSADRLDSVLDPTTSGRPISVQITGLTGYDSWDSAITTKQYIVDYDTSSKEYQVSINSKSKGTLLTGMNLPRDGAVIPLTFDLGTQTTIANVLQNIGQSRDIAKVEIKVGENVLDSFILRVAKYS